MNRFLCILFSILFILYACLESHEVYPPLAKAEKMMNHHPDSALLLLESIGSPDRLSLSDYALYCLLLTQARDKNFIEHTSDLLIQFAVDYYKETENRVYIARSLYLKGRVNDDLGHSEEAARCYLEALDQAKETNDYLLTGLIYDQLGTVYWLLGGLEEPLIYQKQAYAYYIKAADSLYYPFALRDLGRGYWRKKMYDSALINYQEGLKWSDVVNRPLAKASILSEIGSVYSRKGQYDSALFMIRQSLGLTRDTSMMQSRYSALGNIFMHQGEYDSAAYYLNKCKHTELWERKITTYKYLAEIAGKRGAYREAYHYYYQAQNWEDSIADLYKIQKVSHIQHTYHQTKWTEETQRLKLQKSRQSQFYLVVLCLGVIVVLLFYIRYQRDKHRRAYELAISKEKIKTNDALLKVYSIELKRITKKLSDKEKRLREFHHQADWKLQQDVSLLIEKKNKLADSLLEQLDLFRKIKLSAGAKKISGEDWEYLIHTIDTLYDDFTIRLQKAYPQLTYEAVRFCVLIKIGLSNKELMNVLFLSKDAIYKRKSRLKKDLLMPGDERTLDDFLSEF